MSIINNIRFHEHNIFQNQEITLASPHFNDIENNIITLMIGPNGSGKSELLKEIAKSVSYQTIEWDKVPFMVHEKTFSIFKEQEYVFPGINYPPKKIIALAHNLTDKFPLKINNANNYCYLGIRSTTNAAFIGKYKKSFLPSFLKILNNPIKFEIIKEILYMMNLPTQFVFSIKDNMETRKRVGVNTMDFDNKKILENISRLKGEISHLEKNELISYIERRRPLYERLLIDFESPEKNEHFLQYIKNIESLLKYSLAKVDQFYFSTQHHFDITFSDASAGENLLVSSILNLVAEIDDHTLILIDEPESSLHPNWQVEYINIMNVILRYFKGCQIIICTHSHFIVSNTPNKNSLILHAKKEEFGHSFTSLDIDIYGNSPDNVLYTVFGMASTRNHYFKYDLNLILKFISEGEINGEIKDAIKRMNEIAIPYSDPLSRVIEKASKMIG